MRYASFRSFIQNWAAMPAAGNQATAYQMGLFTLDVANPAYYEPGATPLIGAAGQFDTQRLRDTTLAAGPAGTVEVYGPWCDVYYRCNGGIDLWHSLNFQMSDDAVTWEPAGGIYSHDILNVGGAPLANDNMGFRVFFPSRYVRFEWRRPTAGILAGNPIIFGGSLCWHQGGGAE